MKQEFRLKNIDETRNYFLEEIKQKELIILSTFLFYFLQLMDVFQFLFLVLCLLFL